MNSHCILQRTLPKLPWQKLAVQICQHKRKDHLVVIDYYLRWIEIKQLTSLTLECVISRVRAAFSTHVRGNSVVSDNGSQFVSDEFKQFAGEMCSTQQTTTPYIAQENARLNGPCKQPNSSSTWMTLGRVY